MHNHFVQFELWQSTRLGQPSLGTKERESNDYVFVSLDKTVMVQSAGDGSSALIRMIDGSDVRVNMKARDVVAVLTAAMRRITPQCFIAADYIDSLDRDL
ncbi:hypothetical protein SEA_LINETTI_81 [Gordonia phage Linetti]|nr:hypothetical protein SEA_LINETTI_81 [Gordonia phage Linetti]